MKRRNAKYYLAGAVALLTFAAYIPSLQNSFVEWDDSAYVFENLHIRSFSPAFFKWAFFDFYAANWHPLTWISHALDYAVWGLNPMGHHLTNNILHAVNTFIVVLIVVKLLEAASLLNSPHPPLSLRGGGPESFREGVIPPGAGDSQFTTHDSRLTIYGSRLALIAAGTTGLLFGLHPLHVESVAWVAERKDLLCALFYLLSIMAYTGYVGKGGPLWPPEEGQPLGVAPTRTYILALFFFILALLSKPMAVSLPLVLLILDWYPFQRIRSSRSFLNVLTEKLPFIALSLISSILTVLAQKTGDALLSTEAVPLATRALVAAQSLAAYLWKMIFPLNLVPFYPYPNDASFFSFEYLSAIVFVTGITAAGIVLAKRQKIWLAIWGYYVATLIPVLGIVQAGSQAMADRYAYLPSAGPFLIVGLAVSWFAAKLDKIIKEGLAVRLFGAASLLLLFVPMTYLTVKQIGIWKNSIELWSYVIDKEPQTYFAYNNRGLTFYAAGQLDAAMKDYNRAIALYPAYLKSHYNLGLVLYEKGFLDRAIEEYQIAVRLDSGYANAHLNLGVAYSKKGLTDKSMEEYRIVERLNNGSADPFYQLGAFFTKRGLLDEAVEQLQIAVRMKPDFADAHNYLAAALYRKGLISDALEHYLIFARLSPDDAAGRLSLGAAYAAMGFLDKAIEQFQYALRLNPGYVDAHYNLGMAYQAKGFMDQAVEQLEAAARLNPADAAIRNDLDRAYNVKNSLGRAGRMPDAK